jgi:3-hydroxyacyl-[acyl-carrier-protein] dehydratase
MLMNDFYRIQYLQRDPNSVSCKIAFNSQHDIFKASNSGRPVVPGVCMMEMVKELLEQQTDQNLWMRNMDQVKFLQMVTSDEQPMIEISWQQSGRSYNVSAAMKNGSDDLFRLNGYFEKK